MGLTQPTNSTCYPTGRQSDQHVQEASDSTHAAAAQSTHLPKQQQRFCSSQQTVSPTQTSVQQVCPINSLKTLVVLVLTSTVQQVCAW